MIKKRVNAKVLEVILLSLMALFGVSAVIFAVSFIGSVTIDPLFIVIEVLIILIITVLALSYLVVRVWEQQLSPYYNKSVEEKKK